MSERIWTPCATGFALALIERHLGLAGLAGGGGARLVMAGREGPSLLWFVFADDHGEQAWLGVAPAGGDSWAYNGRSIKICCRVPEGAREAAMSNLQRLVLPLLADRLDGVAFERLKRLLPAASSQPGGEESLRRVRSHDWAHPDFWREFCFFSVVEWCPGNTFLGSYAMSGSCCSIRYGDLECQSGQLVIDGVPQTPWDFFMDPGGEQGEGREGVEYLALIDDRDVILGTGVRKVEEILDALAQPGSEGSVQFYNCCIPMMTGDKVRAPLARFEQSTGRKVVFSDMSPLDCHHESLSRRVKKELSAARQGRPVPGRFNLAGFRNTRGREELVGLLAEAGAELNLAILPQFELQSLSRYLEAGVQALMPNRYYEDIYAVLGGCGLGTVAGCAPFGKAGALKWLRELAALLGEAVGTRLETLLSEREEEFEKRWGAWTSRARAYRAGFVLGPGDAALLGDPARSGGVLVPAMLHEMGFGVDFLVFEGGGAGARAEMEGRLRSLSGGAGCGVLSFRDQEELSGHLSSGRLAIVYSNFRHDARLMRNGVMGFSLRDIEMGLFGALRTVVRLVERCDLPFFRDNARRLRAAA